jgi:hypothetical protein
MDGEHREEIALGIEPLIESGRLEVIFPDWFDDRIPMSEIGIAVSKRFRAAVVDNFRSFALEKLGRARKSLRADES